MNIDRKVIKSQAKQLMKNYVIELFILCFIVTLLTVSLPSALASLHAAGELNKLQQNGERYSFQSDGDIDDFDGFDDFYNKNFGNQGKNNHPFSRQNPISKLKSKLLKVCNNLSRIAALVLAPLNIMLCSVFLWLIYGRKMKVGEGLTYIFKNTFGKNYFNLFLEQFISSLIIGFMYCLLIVPGIVFTYRYYFAAYILAEHPDFSWDEALRLSKKMTDGHKGELFVLDLSFLLQYFLMLITFGLAGIYYIPYIQTVKALYYENFKRRGLVFGEIHETDFMLPIEKARYYGQLS